MNEDQEKVVKAVISLFIQSKELISFVEKIQYCIDYGVCGIDGDTLSGDVEGIYQQILFERGELS